MTTTKYATATPKTLEEHHSYLEDICRLKLWYIWHWKSCHPEEPITDILRNRVDIYRKTDINKDSMNPQKCHWDNPAWQNIELELSKLYSLHTHNADEFEHAAFAVIWPSVEQRCHRDFHEEPYVNNYQCGSLTFNKPSQENPNEVFFHVANAVSPRSIFDFPSYLPACLKCVMRKSFENHRATQLRTATWLNDHPAWQKLFPPVWMERMTPPDTNTSWHFGFWGQFINARGTFNQKLGQQLRQTGQFPYAFRSSWCTHQELQAHLDKSL